MSQADFRRRRNSERFVTKGRPGWPISCRPSLPYDGRMNLTFTCPQCETDARLDVEPRAGAIECPSCHRQIACPRGAWEGDQLTRCLVCPSTDLFVRKDFPQRLGVTIVVIGFVASSIAWGYTLPILTFGILFATALIDVVLYAIVPDALMCYRCGAQYRMVDGIERHGSFNLETHERHRQQKARMAEKASS
jgi:hypothetical protein